MATLRSLDDQIHIPIPEGESLLIGRMEQCDIHIADDSISSQHAQIMLEDNVLQVVDLDSTNGTRVNYRLVDKPMILLNGDTIEFGSFSFTVNGPELLSPKDGTVGLSELKEIDSTELPMGLDQTMHISGLEAVDLEDSRPPLKTQKPSEKEKTPVMPFSNPVGVVSAIAILILLLAGSMLLAHISKLPLPF